MEDIKKYWLTDFMHPLEMVKISKENVHVLTAEILPLKHWKQMKHCNS